MNVTFFNKIRVESPFVDFQFWFYFNIIYITTVLFYIFLFMITTNILLIQFKHNFFLIIKLLFEFKKLKNIS